MTSSKIDGFRLGIYVFEDAEVVDFAAPYGVFSVARRYDPALDVFLVAETLRPVQAQAGFTVLPNYDFASRPAMHAFLIPGGAGTRPETYNTRLHEFIRGQPPGMCTGSWILARAGLLDGLPATCRKEPDRSEAQPPGMVPVDRLASLAPACHVSRARVVDAGRVITAGGISAGTEMGFHLLRRAGYDEAFVDDVARVMEYTKAYEAYRDDRETAARPGGGGLAVLAAFSVTPLGAGESAGDHVAEAVRIVRASGLPSETNAMFTNVEGNWDEIMPVIRACIDKVAEAAPRVTVIIKLDWRPGQPAGRLSRDVESVERRLR